MKGFIKLYVKELKQIRLVVLVLLILYTGCALYLFSLEVQGKKSDSSNLAVLLITFATYWVAPVLFAYTLNDEFKQKTLHQLHSLPERRIKIIFSKYCAAFTVSIVTIVGSGICYYLLMKGMPERLYNSDPEVFTLSLHFFSFSVWFLGIVCIAAGIMLSISRYRQIACIGTVIALMYFSGKLLIYARPLLLRIGYLIEPSGQFHANVAGIFFGIVFAISGFVIFEKYSQV